MAWFERIRIKSRLKWAAVGGFLLSFISLMVHMFLAKSSSEMVYEAAIIPYASIHVNESVPETARYSRRLWRNIESLEPLHSYSKPRSQSYKGPNEPSNGFIYAKIHGGFENIRNSICDLVTVSRLLNATLVLPEIQESMKSRGISSNLNSFSYLYDEKRFIESLANDVVIVKNLPQNFKEARRTKQYPIFKPKRNSPAKFYLDEILPTLKDTKFVGLIVTDGGCLKSALPRSLVELQRLRCRVAFHALHFRSEIVEVANRMVERLRGSGHPYIAYHPGLKRDVLAYHGCAELFQDVHVELIKYRRKQMIKSGIVKDDLEVDSYSRKGNGSCPLMPEEVGLLLQAVGYPTMTRIYLAGSETFGGQRILIPLHSMYAFVDDRTSLCSRDELATVIGQETRLPVDVVDFSSRKKKSPEQIQEEWNRAGPRPRPLPPPPDRPIYQHEKEGWYGWIGEEDEEPVPSPRDLREQSHRLLWDAIDYIVSVEADAFFPGFDNDGSGWPDFSGLVKGHRLYKTASSRTYRPDRKFLALLLNTTSNYRYRPPRNWTVSVREHLNQSTGEEGVARDFYRSKPCLFLAHPSPECTCTTAAAAVKRSPDDAAGNDLKIVYKGQDKCPPEALPQSKAAVRFEDDGEVVQEDASPDAEPVQPEEDQGGQLDIPSLENDEEMDPDE
ncbi:hypothetical protein M569_07379 [Genlisea aurea]|uniref:O-fucosyltransferase family protein n=1 Tax=Genlisea aurea TaxID=192259 RepID=S8DW50_9LAMI|nr:hypothetical protein M569_07379 [Genlisea aurea]